MADDRQPGSLAGNPAQVLDTLVYGRRSIRKYKKDPLPEAWLRAILDCAHQAPSPSNSQPVRFVRIASDRHIETLKQSLSNGHSRLMENHKAKNASARLRNWINAYHRYCQFMFTSPVLLAVGVTTETQGMSSKLAVAGLIENDIRQQTDLDMTVGLALQGLMLKAWSLGVGSCVLTAPLVFMGSIDKLIGLENISIKCFVTLGFADEAPKGPERLPLPSVIQVI
jgi:nitroreductase